MELMLQAFIFLAAGVIAVPLASRLGLGSVLGYLIAGALIGPFALGFVKNPESIMHIAEFGVVMMLFLIGLELEPSLLWRMRGPILGLGGLQVIVTAAALGSIAYYIVDLSWQSSIAIGLILSLSSTAIALQILAERQHLKSESGQASFAVLLFQDIAVIPIIAVLPLLALSGKSTPSASEHSANLIAHFPAWQQAAITIGVIVGIILGGRLLLRPLLRFIADSQLREIFTAASLMLVVGIALLMSMVGLSPALGAFIAGVVLATSEYRHELEATVEPFKALLLGLFFMSVGANIDFELLIKKPLLITYLVLGLVVVKFIILLLLARLYRISHSERYWFAFCLAQGGEFGFVLLSLAFQNNVITENWSSLLTVTIALSMLTTPVLIMINERLLQPRLRLPKALEIGEDAKLTTPQSTPVIIAGFGRFGQIVGRLLVANNIPVTVLDNNTAHIERVRPFGFKVFYGDASRADLLEMAGAATAQVLVIAIDEKEKIRDIIRIAKKYYPNLKLYVRAYDMLNYQELQALGVDHVEREMFRSSLSLGRHVLEALGMRAYQAQRKATQFAIHDKILVEAMGKIKAERGSKAFVSEARRVQEEVLELLQADRYNRHYYTDHTWEPLSEVDLSKES
jgi:glutathione-regulated potassium-efflux system ancillary protein KefC/glutathione-regulated potassium-efflux system protein KefB